MSDKQTFLNALAAFNNLSMPYGLYVIVPILTKAIIFCSSPYKSKSFHLIGFSTMEISINPRMVLKGTLFQYPTQLENLTFRRKKKRNIQGKIDFSKVKY